MRAFAKSVVDESAPFFIFIIFAAAARLFTTTKPSAGPKDSPPRPAAPRCDSVTTRKDNNSFQSDDENESSDLSRAFHVMAEIKGTPSPGHLLTQRNGRDDSFPISVQRVPDRYSEQEMQKF